MSDNQTIAAIATPPGMGGVGVIRVSGNQAYAIAAAITGKTLTPRQATYASFKNQQGQVLDKGIVIYFNAPYSYTGEPVVEFQGHGGIYVLQSILQLILSYDVRQAQPGEFSQRAFLNNKMDLLQVEAVADLIESRSQSAANAALKSLSGEFSAVISTLQAEIIQLRIYIEAALDFSDEEIDFLDEGNVSKQVDNLLDLVNETIAKANYGKLLHDGIDIVLVGEPNVGKSSLLNQLLGHERAIVTEQAGTTRDTLEESLLINDIPVRITDTAGLRESNDAIEQAGIARTHQALAKADLAIWLRDIQSLSDNRPAELAELDYIEVHNKADLFNRGSSCLQVSAKTGQGIPLLIESIAQNITIKHNEEGIFSARERHIQALQATRQHIEFATKHIKSLQTSELVAEELRLAQHELSEITGEYHNDDLLGAIFSSFCIGK